MSDAKFVALAGLLVAFVSSGLSFTIAKSIYQPKPEDPPYTMKVEVVNPWGGKQGKYGMEGEIVGHLYIAKREESDHPYYVWFIHKGDTCRYGGDIAWESVSNAVRGKGPMFKMTVVPHDGDQKEK